MAYPDVSEVIAYLTAAGYEVGTANVQAQLDATVDEWERLTGWAPFLAGAEPETRFFIIEVPKTLDLLAGLVSVVSVTVADTELAIGTDFRLKPDNALARKLPYTWIEFLSHVWCGATVEVNGRWGYCATLPANVRRAIVEGAAARCALSIERANSQGLKAVKIGSGDLEVQFASLADSAAKVWASCFLETARLPVYQNRP